MGFSTSPAVAVAAAPAPVLTSGQATPGDPQGAGPSTRETLSGTVESNGCAVSQSGDGTYVRFEAEPDSSFTPANPTYTIHTPFHNLGSVSNQPYGDFLQSLSPNTTYHWRIQGRNVCGGTPSAASGGADQTFTTAATPIYGPPTAVTTKPQPSNSDGAHRANFFGTVNPNGCPSIFSFGYRALGHPFEGTPALNRDVNNQPLDDSSVHEVGLSVSPLQPDTTYDVLLSAINYCPDDPANGRVSNGDIMSFTTLALPEATVAHGLRTDASADAPPLQAYLNRHPGADGALPPLKASVPEPGSGAFAVTTLITNDGATIISNDGGTLVSEGGSAFITDNGSGLITDNGGALLAQSGGKALQRAATATAASADAHTATLCRAVRKGKCRPLRKTKVLLGFVSKKFTAAGKAILKLKLTHDGRLVFAAIKKQNKAARRAHRKIRAQSMGLDELFLARGQSKIADGHAKLRLSYKKH